MKQARLSRCGGAGLRLSLVIILAIGAVGCGGETDGAGAAADSTATSSGSPAVTGPARATPKLPPGAEPGEWTIPARDYASTRFSELDQITTRNVGGLRLAWSFSTGVLRGHEAAPIVADGKMYVVTPHPNLLYALDIETGAQIWKYDPGTALASQGVACCDVVNRGAAYADGRVFFNTRDVHTVAVDAKSGKELWKTKLGDINQGETMTMAPLVVGDLVYVGNSGGEFGVRGWITALEAGAGKIAWRAYHTGPDADVLIGPRFKPFYAPDRAKDLGVTTWPPDQWKIGGGAVWGGISYDPEVDAIYYGTSNPGVWNPAMRPGDNKWATSLFARDARTGEALWAYQTTPHDEHDYDGVNEVVLLDLEVQGRMRKVLVRPGRNGFMYVLDRRTGEVLSAEPYGLVNWAFRVDLETGRPVLNPEKATGNRKARNICPAAPGMKDWQPSAFSPRTGLLYLPHNNLCMDYEGGQTGYIAGTPYVGAQVKMYAGPGGHRGVFGAWDPAKQRMAWEIKERFPVWSGTVVTAGDVAFYGTMDRWFKAVDARSGKPLWQFQVGSGIIGQPVTYLGPDGRQYVAILAGVGGWAGAAALGILPEVDPFIALGFANAMKDLPKYTAQGGTLYVFALEVGRGAAGQRGRAATASTMPTLRVCADPNNLPFSNRAERGFENRIARLVAADLGAEVRYTWWAQRRGFVRNTLTAGECDLIPGVPARFQRVATTAPYYRSTYVFVTRRDLEPALESIDDPRLRRLRIGVHLIGDDYANPPPVTALARRGIVRNVAGYSIYGDYREPNPPARLVEAVARGEVDVAIVWGPLGGYFATREPVPLRVTPLRERDDGPDVPFGFAVSMGVRPADSAFAREVGAVLARRRGEIDRILEEYGVPRPPSDSSEVT